MSYYCLDIGGLQMSLILYFIGGIIIFLGGLGLYVSTETENISTAISASSLGIGGFLIFAFGRVIDLLEDIRDNLKKPQS